MNLLPIVRAASEVENAQTVLRDAIRLAHKQGHSLREIAKAANISHEQVRRLIRDSRLPQ